LLFRAEPTCGGAGFASAAAREAARADESGAFAARFRERLCARGPAAGAATARFALFRFTGAIGSGFRLSAISAWAVTQIGVCELERE
jgi:hypothetical protein